MLNAIKIFEKGIIWSLAALMAVTVLLSTLEFAIMLWVDISTPPYFILELNELMDIFGMFLLILLGMELLETVKAYLKEEVIHVEVVLIVSLIAIARKVIILDVKEVGGSGMAGMAALLAALVGGYVYIRRTHGNCPPKVQSTEAP